MSEPEATELTARQLIARVARIYMAPRWKGWSVALLAAVAAAFFTTMLVQILEPATNDLMVFHKPHAIIVLPLTIAGEDHKTAKEKTAEVVKRLNIGEIIHKYPYEMSGGERQRVAAARAIITKPALILADEPTGALDSKSARMLMECLDSLNRELGATILMVTHDAFTASYCSRILFIKDGMIFNELLRGKDSRKEFFTKIIDVVTLLGGDAANVL
jgi:ABC-type dipeptide/oligopeptide/nickel transport system ATPase component